VKYFQVYYDILCIRLSENKIPGTKHFISPIHSFFSDSAEVTTLLGKLKLGI